MSRQHRQDFCRGLTGWEGDARIPGTDGLEPFVVLVLLVEVTRKRILKAYLVPCWASRGNRC